MRVRACLKCKEYVVINPVDPMNQRAITQFEKAHKGHMLATLDFREIADQYNNFLNENLKTISERYESLINGNNNCLNRSSKNKV